MGFKCGIVGLPNVGKSTLFNALTQTASAEAANYPFCTIEPNVGKVCVPDSRLAILAEIAHSKTIIPTQLEFVDIAGLVRGASKGEGLGNQFLAHIRETDAIIEVVRCFADDNVTHVENNVDPLRDIELVETELILADLESTEKRLAQAEKRAKTDKKVAEELEILRLAQQVLLEGKMLNTAPWTAETAKAIKALQLITSKPVLYVCNVSDTEVVSGNALAAQIAQQHPLSLNISAKIEADIALLETAAERQEFLQELGLQETGLAKVIRAGYQLLDLLTFFTVGEKETHAWTIPNGTLAPGAAGVIHTDFAKGFIRAETISYQDYVTYQGEEGARNAGKLRVEGKDYRVQDGDIFHFRFNV